MLNKKLLLTLLAASGLGIAGCSSNRLELDPQQLPIPENWATQVASEAVSEQWVLPLQTAPLQAAVSTALNNNHQLRQQWYTVEIAKQSAIIAGADLWPSLSSTLTGEREDSSGSIDNSTTLYASLSYELDIWGQLKDQDRQAALNLAAAEATYQDQVQQLVADVTLAWFEVVKDRQLLELAQQQLAVTKQNLDIIEVGYKQGLYEALDVYLARNSAASEESTVANAKTTWKQSLRALELLLGEYPAADIQVETLDIPLLEQAIPAGLPSELISRNPSLQAQWLAVLAQDAALAYAHKDRFPSISLTADAYTSGGGFSELFSLADLSWSLAGSLTAPIFQAGSLKAAEKQEELELRQTEQAYLDALYSSFADAENGLTAEMNLQTSYAATQQAEANAIIAEELSFEQYRKGIVSYTTVLDAQTRSVSAQSALIQLKYQLLENRIQLMLTLGGDFATVMAPENTLDASH